MPDEKKPAHAAYRDHALDRPRPPLPQTQQVDAAPAWAISMQERIIAKQDANHALVVGEMEGIKGRLGDLEKWRETGRHKPIVMPDGTTTTPSGFMKRISESDTTQNLDIAALRSDLLNVQKAQEEAKTERHLTAEQVKAVHDIVVTAGRAFIDSPHFKLIKTITYVLLAGYALTHGIRVGP